MLSYLRQSRQKPASPAVGEPAAVDQAFAYCESLARTHYENFTVGSWFLPRDVRRHVYSVYAYCRSVDDLGDEAEGDRLAHLDRWEEELRRSYEGTPRHPVMVALGETNRRFHIPIEPYLKLIEANRMDQTVHRFPTYADLLHYCDHSANPVGHLFLYLFGYSDPERQRLADSTCTALQLTNFWQDVRRDLDMGRIYIPVEDMERFGYSDVELQQHGANDAFKRLMEFEVGRARALFKEGLRLVNMVEGGAKLDIKLFNLGGMRVLDAIERTGFDVLRRRPALSKREKIGLMLSTMVKLKLAG